jgi:RimJ/RimL family protein N-acetyltransferase
MTALTQAILLEISETLETERLKLVATRTGVGAATNAAVTESHEALRSWMPWARTVPTLEESEQHCREMHAKWYARQVLDFCFVRKSDAVLVGKGGLHTIDWDVPKFEIGYWTRSSCVGQGIATEATLALVEFARAVLGARRIEITCDARNTASRRVAEKSGFVLEGIRRNSRHGVDGRLADSCMYARTF